MRPSTTVPLAPLALALVLMSPPYTAFTMPFGAETNTTAPAGIESIFDKTISQYRTTTFKEEESEVPGTYIVIWRLR